MTGGSAVRNDGGEVCNDGGEVCNDGGSSRCNKGVIVAGNDLGGVVFGLSEGLYGKCRM